MNRDLALIALAAVCVALFTHDASTRVWAACVAALCVVALAKRHE